MSKHTAKISWQQDEEDHFSLGRYTRVHEVAFDCGTTIEASGAPQNVPAQFSSETSVDPEEMFVASLASCHMLWFLDLARRAGHDIRSYRDNAVGEIGKTPEGRTAILRVTLRPQVECEAGPAALEEIHHKAHDACFIANSVTTEVVVEPQS